MSQPRGVERSAYIPAAALVVPVVLAVTLGVDRATADPVIPAPLVPSFHRRIPHIKQSTLQPQPNAHFGYSMVMGNVDDPLTDSLDDLVVAATGTDTPTLSQVGAVYPFVGPNLVNTGVTVKEQFPVPEQDQLQMGLRFPAIGQVDTSIPENLVFMCSFQQDALSGFPGEGAIQVFHTLALASPQVLTLRPPGETFGAPAFNVKGFGHSVSIGDVDGDGVADLVTGAHNSKLCTTPAPGANDYDQGRIYVFFGGPGWTGAEYGTQTNPTWVGIISPKIPSNCAGAIENETFGSAVLVVDLNQDGYGEIVVGAPEVGRSGIGRVYIFDGVKVAALPRGMSHHSQPGAMPPNPITPDQTLVPQAPYNTAGGRFGYVLYAIQNMGGSSWPGGRQDIAIQAATNWTDPSTGQTVPFASALHIYYGSDNGAYPFVNEASPTVLFAPVIQVPDPATGQPVTVHAPQQAGGFGRAAGALNWPVTIPGLGVQIRTHLLVGDPGADVQDPNDPAFPNSALIRGAGRVFIFQAPLDAADGKKNAWGSFVLLEPSDIVPEKLIGPYPPLTNAELRPTAGALFGAYISAGNYTNQSVGWEFAAAGRAKNVPWPTPTSSTITSAGQVYTFRSPD